jgi:hypothetical protein
MAPRKGKSFSLSDTLDSVDSTTDPVDLTDRTDAGDRPARNMAAATTYERVDAPLVPGQHVQLTEWAKQLQRTKTDGNPRRITANTLIRVAVEALLSDRELIVGSNEDELVASARRARRQ